MACTFKRKLTISSWPKPSLFQRSTKARQTSIGFGRNTYVDVAHTSSNTAIWKTMMNRSAGFEITRFGENAPSTSCRKLTRPPTPDVLAAMLPAAGFMVVTEGFLFLARQNDFYAPVLCSAFGSTVRCEWLGVAIGMNAETAVGEVRGSFSL